MTIDTLSLDGCENTLRALREASAAELSDYERLGQELRIHQLELKVQNAELREAQNALEVSRSRYSDLYDFAPIPYFTFDQHGAIIDVNLTGAKMVGRERAQLIGTPFASMVDFVDHSSFRDHLCRCGQSREPVVTELTIVGANQTPVRLRAVSNPVAAGARPAGEVRTAFIDITDRYRADLQREEALTAERGRRRELEALDTARTLLTAPLTAATENRLSEVLRVVAEQARSIAGADYAGLGIGRTEDQHFDTWVFAGLPPHAAAAIGRAPRRVGVLVDVIVGEHTLRLNDVREYPAFAGFPPGHPPMKSFLGVPILFGGQVVGNLYLTNKSDGTEFTSEDQRNIESLAKYVASAMEIARLGEEAQEAIRTRDNLLAIVSHDLRSPLSAITVSSRLLQRMLESDDSAMKRRQAELITRVAERMNRFIEDLLTASTMDAGRFTVVTRSERIELIVADAVEVVSQVAAESFLRVDVTMPSALRDVPCDRDRIHQVIANLIGNAIKFTPRDGSIAIEVVQNGDDMQISVTDTGPGIPEDMIAHVFDRYWKRDGTGQRGVGLGLYICRGIIESHGGRIWAERTMDRGAKVVFSLPCGPLEASSATARVG